MSTLARTFEANSELLQLEAGLRTVIKRERIPVGRIAEEAAFFTSRGLVAHYDPEWEYGGAAHDLVDTRGTGHTSLFVAHERGPAEEALALSQAEAGPGARPDASGRIGELLGYPPCCVEAWLSGLNSPTSSRGPAGIYLDAWQRTEGRFDPRLNRLGAGLQAISHRPCRYDCAASIDLADRTLAVMEATRPGLRDRFLSDAAQAVVVWSGDRWRSCAGEWTGDMLRLDRWRGPPAPELAAVDAALADAVALRWRPGVLELRAPDGAWVAFGEAWPLELPWLFPFDGGPGPRRAGTIAIGGRVDGGPLRLDRALLVGDFRRQGIDAVLTEQSEPAPPGCPPDEVGVEGRRGRLLGGLAALYATPGAPETAPGGAAPFDPVRTTDEGTPLRGIDFGREGEADAGLGPTWPVPGWTGGLAAPELSDAIVAARRWLGGLDWIGIPVTDPWADLAALGAALEAVGLAGATLLLRGTEAGLIAAEAPLRELLPTLPARVVLHGLQLSGTDGEVALAALRRLHAAAPEAFDPFAIGGVDGTSTDGLAPDELPPTPPWMGGPVPRTELLRGLGSLRVGQAIGKRWRIERMIARHQVRLVLTDGREQVVIRHARGWSATVEAGPPRAAELLARVSEELLRAGPTPWPEVP